MKEKIPLMQLKLQTIEQGVWFTSDSHQSHGNIMKFCPRTRPFSSIEEMDKVLADRWNSVVKENDIVFHLGDFFFMKDLNKAVEYLKTLNGKIFLILGNHDQLITNNFSRFMATGKFIGVEKKQDIVVDGQAIVLDHFPNAVWNRNHYGAWNLHGHTHGSYEAVGKQLDVGCDSNYFIDGEDSCRPLSFSEIKAYMDCREKVLLDQHKPREKVE